MADKTYLDRYELVAVAIPGGAFLLFFWYLCPQIVGADTLELKDVSLGTLGIFTVAAFVAGQFIQAVANVVEEILNFLADVFVKSPIAQMSDPLRQQIKTRLVADGFTGIDADDRRQYRLRVNRHILRVVRGIADSTMLDIFNVTYGLNRGLTVAAACGLIIAAVQHNWGALMIFVLLGASTALRCYRASRRFENEMLGQFARSNVAG